jgi:hypothetical protein
MGFRFRKSIKIAPGVRLNVSKGGTSWSIGRRGATLNVGGKNGPRATGGIPGTGLSYSENLTSSTKPEDASPGVPESTKIATTIFWIVAGLFFLWALTKCAG